MEKERKEAALAGLLTGIRDLLEAGGQISEEKWSKLRPEEIPEDLIAQARQLASGSEKLPALQSGQLLSPFCGLHGHQEAWYLPLSPLNPLAQQDTFPSPQQDPNPKKKIATLQSLIDKDWDQANPASLDGKIETLLALLGKYAWSVPSAVEGVSIYDLARTTAAIAFCLADSNNTADDKEHSVGILVSGDFSGLQKFLYTLASAGAAKSLRARSVYLQWLAEAVTYSLLHELGLPLSNVLYVGGGGFQLLAPLNAKEKLPALMQDFSERLLKLHKGELGLTLAWEKLNKVDFSNFGEARARLGKKLNIAKRRPFAGASLEALQEAIGKPITQGGDPLTFCHVTGEDGKTIDKNEQKSYFVKDLETLGLQLRQATHLVFVVGDKKPAQQAISWQQALSVFGFHARLMPEWQKEAEQLPSGLRRVWRFKPEMNIQHQDTEENVRTYRSLAQLIAWDENKERPKTFDELAEEPLQGGGFKRWGVLRMDVDNLGTLFKEGYDDKVSIARSAGLSFALRLFFEGWLPQLAEGKKGEDIDLGEADLREHLYLQYSGGDDIFIVGAWDALPEFARRIRASLREFTAQNPHLTLSGGIDIFHAKFPLYQAAQRAGEAEHAAKDYKHSDGKEKDAISFLGQVMSWERFEEVSQQAYQMAALIESKDLPRAALQSILSLNTQLDEAEKQALLEKLKGSSTQKKRKSPFGSWTWMSAYQLTRMKPSKNEQDKYPKKKEAANLLTTVQNAYLDPKDQEELKNHGLAARWAQFLTRGGE